MESRVTACTADMWSQAESEWEALAEKSAPALCFLGAPWVDTWLSSYGETIQPARGTAPVPRNQGTIGSTSVSKEDPEDSSTRRSMAGPST